MRKMVGFPSIPQWLQSLMKKKFFKSCLIHDSDKKNEENTFCLHCCISLCPHCLPPHKDHRLLQIRRYVYHDVIRLNDAEKLMDCSSVQPYTTNSAKVVFLKQRPTTRQFKGSANNCIICDRTLQYPYIFCSIACKVCGVSRNRVVPIKQSICKWKCSPELQDVRLTPDSVFQLPPDSSLRTSSGSSSSCNNGALTFTTYKPAAAITVTGNRRKGAPHRSPLC